MKLQKKQEVFKFVQSYWNPLPILFNSGHESNSGTGTEGGEGKNEKHSLQFPSGLSKTIVESKVRAGGVLNKGCSC